jgi:hypothetical protein
LWNKTIAQNLSYTIQKTKNLKLLSTILLIVASLIALAQPPVDNGQISSIETSASIESSLKIFPNPTKSTLNISIRIPSISHARISLHDMLGNEVELFSDNASGTFEKAFDINGLRSGIYFVRINYNNGQNTIVKKIIVQ